MTGRVFQIELRRGAPPLAALLTAAAMTWMLAVHPDEWVGWWGGLATYLRVSLLILCPLLVAAGAWQAGRDRRAQLDDLLSTVPRPAWQPLLVSWAAVTVGGGVGLVLPLGVAAVIVGLRATYIGTGWWWTMLVGLVAVPTAAALGMLAGRLAPLRLVAPVGGLAVYLGLAVPIYLHETSWTKLSPVIDYADSTDVWPISFHAWQAGWLAAAGALFLLLAARHWRAAGVPALLALPLLMVPAHAGNDFGKPSADADALALVCTDRTPQICVTRVNAFLLDDVAALLEPGLARAAEVPGYPVRAVDEAAREANDQRGDVLWFSTSQQAKLTAGVAQRDWLLSYLSAPFHEKVCPPPVEGEEDPTLEVTSAAGAWVRGTPPSAIAALPDAEQREWVGAVLTAARACDRAALARLDPR